MNCSLKDPQNISWSIFLPPERKQNSKENVWCAKTWKKGDNLVIGVSECETGLCLDGRFKSYHTNLNL
jgi:hypothetical protein